MIPKGWMPIFLALALLVAPQVHGQAVKQVADVRGQMPPPPPQPRPLVAADGATLIRTVNGLSVALDMPTPMSGSYRYPPGTVPGFPEAFSLVVLVFNFPGNCAGPCGLDDIGHLHPARGGIFSVSGHVMGGGAQLTFAGHISLQDEAIGAALQSPLTAQVQLVVIPHGMLDPQALPEQISGLSAGPPFWWLAVFPPPPN